MNLKRTRALGFIGLAMASFTACSTAALRPCASGSGISVIPRTLRLAEGEPGWGAASWWSVTPSATKLQITVPNPDESFQPQFEVVRGTEQFVLKPTCGSWKSTVPGRTWDSGIVIPPTLDGPYYLCISVKVHDRADIVRECATRISVHGKSGSKKTHTLSERRPDKLGKKATLEAPQAPEFLRFVKEATHNSFEYLLSQKQSFIVIGSSLVSFHDEQGALKVAFRLGRAPNGYVHRAFGIGESAIVLASTGTFVASSVSSGERPAYGRTSRFHFPFITPYGSIPPEFPFSYIYSKTGNVKAQAGGPRHGYANDSLFVESEDLRKAVVLIDRREPINDIHGYQGSLQVWSESGELLGSTELVGWADSSGTHPPLISLAGISDEGRIQIQPVFEIETSSPILAISYVGDEFWRIRNSNPYSCETHQDACPEFISRGEAQTTGTVELRLSVSHDGQFLALNLTKRKKKSEYQEALVMDRHFRVVWQETFAPTIYGEVSFDKNGKVIVQRGDKVEVGRFEKK